MRQYTYRRKHTRYPRRLRRTRRQRTLHQYGKGVEKAWIEPIHQAIQHLFPNSNYDTNFYSANEHSAIDVSIYCPGDEPMDDNNAIGLSVRTDEIYVHGLRACTGPSQQIRGDEILKRIVAMGKELQPLGIQRIRLIDASAIPYPSIPERVGCQIPLAGYKIITSKQHHSWYNSHGFLSKQYDDEVKHNTAFVKEPMMKLVEMTHKYIAYSKKQATSLSGFLSGFSRKKSENRPLKKENRNDIEEMNLDRLVEYFHTVFEGAVTLDMPIEEGIQRIHHIALQATSCKDPKIILYTKMMSAALKYGIMYDNHLTYVIL